jgi:LPXTG-motif cell wall-anchored protein
LPFTGANIAIMVAAGLVLIGIGTAVVMTVRRRRHHYA